MFKWRLVSGLLLGTAALLSLGWPGVPGAAVFTLLCAWLAWVAAGEFHNLAKGCGAAGFPTLTRVFAVLVILAAGFLPACFGEQRLLWTDVLQTGVIATFVALGFLQVFRRGASPGAILDLLASLGGLLYIAWTLAFIPRVYFNTGFAPDGRWLTLFLIAVTKAGDIGAYAAGMLTSKLPGGNHKMMPAVSPKKSWEGFAGGLAASVGTALALVLLLPTKWEFNGVDVLTWKGAVAWGVACTVLGFWGDVAESACKRAAQAKDSGKIPGLGGVLDVLDSLMLVAPFFYAWLRLKAGA
ncbi:MAG: phosphatidate cytidylyltransferase [Lentisphaeria bacterium]|jgi:phosphatidate cytidylyltransferase